MTDIIERLSSAAIFGGQKEVIAALAAAVTEIVRLQAVIAEKDKAIERLTTPGSAGLSG